ncbi:MAG: citrate transporter [Ruminococcaceae bacterium]|nr:citrate transporter [Oscillospiraceae bacterium]
MATLQAIGILVIFVACVILMMTRKLPTILALPIMAIGIALVAGIPFVSGNPKQISIAQDILQDGAMKMSTAITGVIFGGWFGKILTKSGIANTIIRKAAEMAGDHPFPIAMIFLAACSVIFASCDGLGIIILVGTIAIPIMISAGLSPLIAGMVILLSEGIGATFNVSTLGVYIDTLGLKLETVTSYSLLCGIPVIVIAIIMLVYMIKFSGKTRKAWAMPSTAVDPSEKNVRTVALISPLIPVVLVFAFQIPMVPAILIGIAVALLLSTPRNVIQIISSSFIEGLQDTAGAIALMVGIGITLKTVMSPEVANILSPIIKAIIPTSPIMFVLVFGLLCPLAIYRGPLNVWGLGSGIVALLAASGMNPIAAMVALRLDSNVQCVCDPTNSHNVWISDFTKTDVNDYLKNTIAWVAASTVVGLIIAGFMLY